MGTLATEDLVSARKYGELGIRFNSLRGLYRCVASAINEDKNPKGCLDDPR